MVQNPFNGIESIHSVLQLLLAYIVRNPFNGIESAISVP